MKLPHLKKALPVLAVGAFMIMLVAKPDYFLDSASRGLLLFASSVLPTVFPFFFCSTLLTAMGAASSLSRMGAKPVRAMFNAPPSGAYVLALSLLGGYPVGAATVADLYAKGIVNETDAKRIASFTSTSGPIFVLGTVGSAIFGDPAVGALILAAHYAAAVTTGLVFRGRKKSADISPVFLAGCDTDSALSNSISSSTLAMLAVGGYVVVGNMLIDALSLSGLNALITRIPDANAAHTLNALLAGAVEMTRGTILSSEIPFSPLAVACACAVVSFGGLSVMLQSYTFLSRCKMSFTALAARKCVQCTAAFIYAFIFSLIFFTNL